MKMKDYSETVLQFGDPAAGYHVAVRSYLGEAKQFVQAISDGGYYNKHCRFYLVGIDGDPDSVLEPDHRPYWMELGKARTCLTEGAQRWALSQLRIKQ